MAVLWLTRKILALSQLRGPVFEPGVLAAVLAAMGRRRSETAARVSLAKLMPCLVLSFLVGVCVRELHLQIEDVNELRSALRLEFVTCSLNSGNLVLAEEGAFLAFDETQKFQKPSRPYIEWPAPRIVFFTIP